MIELCIQQGALGWELRSAESLTNFLWQRGQNEEATALLEGTLRKFSEGFETVPFRRAKTMLDKLRGTAASKQTPRSSARF